MQTLYTFDCLMNWMDNPSDIWLCVPLVLFLYWWNRKEVLHDPYVQIFSGFLIGRICWKCTFAQLCHLLFLAWRLSCIHYFLGPGPRGHCHLNLLLTVRNWECGLGMSKAVKLCTVWLTWSYLATEGTYAVSMNRRSLRSMAFLCMVLNCLSWKK